MIRPKVVAAPVIMLVMLSLPGCTNQDTADQFFCITPN